MAEFLAGLADFGSKACFFWMLDEPECPESLLSE